MKRLFTFFTLTALSAFHLAAFAQDRPLFTWRSHMPYNTAIGLASDGVEMFVATEKAFYTYNIATFETEGFSKSNGMSDIGMSAIGYDMQTNTVILAYTNGNIDLYKEHNFYNLPDLKLKSISGSKKINHIYTSNGFAYLSTDVGIVVINLDKQEIKETYTFNLNNQVLSITGLTVSGNFFYASSTRGFYRANKNAVNLQAFGAWTKLDTTRNFISVAAVQDKVFVTGPDSLFVLENDALKFIYRSDTSTRHIDAGVRELLITENNDSTFDGKVRKMTVDYQFVDSFRTPGYCRHVLQTDTNIIWLADEFNGMKKREFRGDPFNTDRPEGPSSYPCFDIYANNKDVWVAHGGYNDLLAVSNSGAGFSNLADDKWKNYRLYESPILKNELVDFTRVIKGPDGNVYLGSAQSGLLIIKPDGSTEHYQEKSFIDSSSISGNWYRIGGFAYDGDNNLWMTVYGGRHELVVRSKDGTYYPYIVPLPRSVIPNAADQIIVDDEGQKWYTTMGSASGVIVYNDNGTLETQADDSYKQLFAGKGAGGLPDNEAYCLAKDKSGAIWIGTKNGIGIVNCPGQVLQNQCEAEIRVVKYDNFAGYLFQNEQVKSIAVDGGNRKWIGTNNGVWLVSAEGDKVIHRFTAEDSPLPSNLVQKIAIDAVTGDVYIGTEQGMVSYRSDATDGGTENKDVVSFPNPVPSGYTGTIAIKGLVENADVRITDISGQLVYRTKALGGQAVWNGKDYKGRKPQSGVYLVFITNKDGTQTHTGKMVFME